MPPSVDLVFQHPDVWRGDQYAKVAVASVPTGFTELDAQLPGGGWPRAALTELLIRQQGIGELRLLAPALAHLSREDKWLVLIAPPHLPYAPGFESLGVDLARLIVVRTRSNGESLWAAERCLRAGTCAAVIAWPGPGSERSLRRLQLAAEEGKGLGVIFGPVRSAANASPAALRIQLNAGRGRLAVQILKRRGGGWSPPLSLELDKAHASLRSSFFSSLQPAGGESQANRAGYGASGELRRAVPLREPSIRRTSSARLSSIAIAAVTERSPHPTPPPRAGEACRSVEQGLPQRGREAPCLHGDLTAEAAMSSQRPHASVSGRIPIVNDGAPAPPRRPPRLRGCDRGGA